ARSRREVRAGRAGSRQTLTPWLSDESAETSRDAAPPTLREAPSLGPGMRALPGPAKEPVSLLPGAAKPGVNVAVPAAVDAPVHIAPPPPYRGAPTAAQPPSGPSIAADDPPREIGARLL